MEYTAVLLNRGQVGADGKTGYERLKGKPASMPGLEFAERVQWRAPIKGKRKNTLDAVWNDGIYLGQRTVSGEYIVGDGRRLPDEDV